MSATLSSMPEATKSVRTRGPEKRDKYVALRMMPSEYEAISARAQKRNMNLTEFMVRSSLGQLNDPSSIDERFDQVEERLDILERRVELGSFG